MKLTLLTKNNIALIVVGIIAIGFFIAGLTKILDYVIIKALLLTSFVVLIVMSSIFGWRNHKKNRPDKHQDDLH